MDNLGDNGEIYELPDNVGTVDPAIVEAGIYQRSVAEASDRDDALFTKMALIGFGISKFGKAINRNLFEEAANALGKGMRYIGDFAKVGERANIPRNITSNLGRILKAQTSLSPVFKDSDTKLDSLTLVQDLAESLDILADPKKEAYRDALSKRLKEHFASAAEAKVKPGRITVEDFLAKPEQYATATGDIRQSLEYKILESAKDKGILQGKQALDRGIFLANNKVNDARILNPSNFVSTLSDVFNPFGLVSTVSSFLKSERTVGLIGPDLVTKEHRIFIGGDVFRAGNEGLEKIASGKELGKVGDGRYIASLLREYGHQLPEDKNNNTLADKIQNAIGVGPKFHEKRGGFIRTAWSFLKNLKGVSTGEAKFYGRDYKYHHDSVYNQIFYRQHPELVLETGEELTRGMYAGRGPMGIKDVAPEGGPFKGIRGWFQRLKAYAGFNPDLAIIKKEAADSATHISKEDLYQNFGRAGIPSTEIPIGKQPQHLGPTGVNVLGSPDYTVRASYYDTSAHPIDKVYDFTNWLAIRLNKLASSSLLGIGFKPSGNLLANTARVAAVPIMYMGALEGAQYIDYSVGKLVGEKPSNILADLYVNTRISQQKIRETTGLTGFSNYLENDLFPGVDAGALGTIGAALAGMRTLEATGSVKAALGLAGALYGAIGGPDPGQSADSLQREYTGEEKVPIRKNRFWFLGYTPFKGGQIDYYAPSWYVRKKEQPAQTNVYGSEDNYWKHSSILPTPSNWFGLRTIMDPYAVERMNYYDRPYPFTAKLFEETPIFGPLLADTVGEIIKPTKVMQAASQGYMVASSNISDKGIPTNSAKSLGIPEVPVSVVDLRRPDNFKDRIDKYANVALAPAGVWKFALEVFGIKFDDEYRMADAGNMTSIARQFYDLNIGGALGESEFLRRFLLSDYALPSRINQQINPIPNTMPRWLPGSLSENEPDQTYFTDFTRGDAYSKIPGGEFRLPGPGYESVNKLHSGITNVYSDVDKFLVLSDIAPFSAAYYKQEGIVAGMSLDPYWQSKVEQAKSQRDKKMEKYDFYEPSSSQEQIANANRNPVTKAIRKVWTGVATQTLENIPVLGAKIFPFRSAYEEYASSVVEGEQFTDWKKPIETVVRPAFMTTIGENPFIAAKRGFQMGYLLSSPMASFLNPFPILKTNPVATTIAGTAIGAVGSSVRWASTGSFEHGWVPPHKESEREVTEYFDYIKYAKSRFLQARAEESGNARLANVFARQSQQTVNYGLAAFRETGDPAKYMSSLSREDRPFFEAFVNAPQKDRSKILKIVPSHMKEVLSAMYEGQAPNPNGPVQEQADERAVEYFGDHKLPGSSWMGWSPSVPMTAIQIKSVQAGINGVSDSIHRFNFFPVQQKETNIRFPDLEPVDTEIIGQSESSINLSLSNILQPDNPFGSISHSRRKSTQGPYVNWFAGHIHDSRRNDVFAFMNDVYR